MDRKIVLMSNVTTALLEQKLKKVFQVQSLNGYNTWIFEILDEDSFIYKEEMDGIFLLLHGRHEAETWKDAKEGHKVLQEWLGMIERMVDKVRKIPVFVSTMDLHSHVIRSVADAAFEYEWENAWYQSIQKLSESHSNVYVFDVRNLIADLGRKQFYSSKMWYMGSMPYSIAGMKAIVQKIEELMQIAYGRRMKSLALDLDNTLWGGVIGEDGVEGIQLEEHKEGARYYDLQKRILDIKKSGIVLSVLSKNNTEDVEEVFEKHPYMVLKKEDFAAMEINWEDKPSNLRKIAGELNFGTDAIVFLDDNPAEREQMKELCREVEVAEFPDDTAQLPQTAEQLFVRYFQVLRTTGEDRKKAEMYRQEMQRKEVQKQFVSVDDYLKNLEIEVLIHRMTMNEVERVVQLCNKTNQFNLTTKRYTRADIMNYAESKNADILTVYSKDRFGDNGLTAVLILLKEGEMLVVDTFLMSCRVMGRKLENVIMNECINFYRNSFHEIQGHFVETAKNKPVADLYDRLQFQLTADYIENGHQKKIYSYQLQGPVKQLECYKSVEFECMDV